MTNAFDFTTGFETNVAIPADTGTTDKLPFKAMFTAMVAAMTEAKAKDIHKFIPASYWTLPLDKGGRGVDPKKATHGYIRAKLREQFNAWQKLDEASRGELVLIPINRTGKEEGFSEMGVSIWISNPAVEAEKAPTKK